MDPYQVGKLLLYQNESGQYELHVIVKKNGNELVIQKSKEPSFSIQLYTSLGPAKSIQDLLQRSEQCTLQMIQDLLSKT